MKKSTLITLAVVAIGACWYLLPSRRTGAAADRSLASVPESHAAQSHAADRPLAAPEDQAAGSAPGSSPVPAVADQPADASDFGAWAGEAPRTPDFAKIEAFEKWTGKWKEASPEARVAMTEEGRGLAVARRPEFKALIASDPRQALERSVPRVVRQDLPAEIVAELERPVSATGDLNVYKARPAPGMPVPAAGLTLRYFEANNMSYKARVFGGLEPQMTSAKIPVRGVAIDRELAVAESPVRQLEIGERIPAGTVVEDVCPVSGKTTEAVASGEPVTEETPTIEVGEKVITLCDGSHVTVMDEKYRVLVQAAGSGGGGFYMENFPGTTSRSIGAFKCLYIRVIYQEQTSPPNTEESAYKDMRDNARFYIENSYGKMVQTTTFTPLVTLPHTQKWYLDKDGEVDGLGLVHNDSRAAAKALGYDPGQFDCIVVRVNGGPRLNGISWGGGSSVWVSWDGMDVLNHECGHSLGLNHANYWETTDGTAYGTGFNVEYGNSYDVMGGAGGFSGHYNTISKRLLGWLPSNYDHAPKANGVYRIYAYDQPRLEEGKRYGLTVAKDSIRSYNIEYHPARGGLLADQALVLYSGMGSNVGHLMDTTPGTYGGKSDAGIAVGRTYSDRDSDQHFTVVSVNATTPPSLDIAYNKGPFPGNLSPAISSLAATATTINAGESVTFTVSATDPNGDPLAYSWLFSDGSTGTNTASFTRSFASADQIVAMCTVSDMKGGTDRQAVVINVGAHGKKTISGTLTANGTPVAGALVKGGGESCYSSKDGTYTLAGLTPNTQVVMTVTSPGINLKPDFVNPVYLAAADIASADWTSENPFPGNQIPVIASLTPSATTISTGGSVTFTASASDPDGDPLTYNWQFSDGAVGANNATYTRTFSSTDQIVANCIVTDSKGSSAWATVVINVGSHDRKTISGKVTRASDGTPIGGVYLTIDGEFCYSNTDGTYTLAGVSTGVNKRIRATLGGLAFTPTFGQNFTLSGDVSNYNWNEVDDAVVTLAKVADATEGGTGGTFRLTRAGGTSAALTVLVAPAGGTATKTTDYTFTPDYVNSGSYKAFTIPAGSATLDIAVAAVNDTAAEGPETVTLQLVSSAGSVPGGANSVTMTINDNDTTLPLVAVTAPDSYATEAPGSTDTGKFIFTRAGSTAAALNVIVAWSGAATNGADFTTLPTTVTIPAGQSSVDVIVSPANEGLVEGPEDVVATISTNAAYLRDAGAMTASVNLSDDDTPVVTVSVPDPDASEASQNPGTFLLTRTGDTSAPLTVYYGLTGAASYGTDYAGLTGQVTILAGATSAPVVISPYDDDIGELAETVVLSLSAFNNTYSIGAVNQGTVMIADNNDPVLVTVRAGSIGTEGGSNATLVFRSTGSGSGTVTVNYTVGGTATPGSDYTALSGSVSVPANGSNDTTVSIPLTNDTTAEPTETVVATITPGAGYQVYNDPSATALIRDNDSGGERVMVSNYNKTPSETGPAAASFYFSRAVGTSGDLTVSYTVSGTATNGADYATLSGTCLIPAGAWGVNVPVTPVDDTLAEGTETVMVTVASGTSYSADFPSSATCEITDNDAPAVTVGFQQASLATIEQPGALGEYRDLPVVLSASSTNTVTVRVIAGGGDAMGDDVDWAFVDAANGNAVIPYATLTFAPGTTSKNVRIRVKNDGYAESGEIAVLQLTAANNAGITSGKGAENVLIFDDQIPALVTEERWNSSAVYTNNTWSSVTPDYTGLLKSFTPAQNVSDNYSRRLTGQITAPVTGTYTFWIASDDGSRLYLSTDATAANKVQIASLTGSTGFQNWDANVSQVSGNISLVAGQSYYMEVQQQDGGGGDHVSVAWQGPGFSRTPIVTPVQDNAPRTVRMLSAASTRVEGDGSEPMLQVLLDRPAGATPVTVNYSSTGTATHGSDYTLANGTLTFNSGEQMKPLPLSILIDAIGEAPEAIVVSLSGPSGASLITPSSMTITLLDASAPVVDNVQAGANSSMAAGTVIGTATATPVSGRSITGWTIVAGNENNSFAINASGQVTLQAPGSLPNPGIFRLVVRAIDSVGATGDGSFRVACNPPSFAGVSEKRFSGSTAYNSNTWTGTPNYTGTLTTFTTPQNVADSYSRQLVGYIQPPITGAYTFWVASDDNARLYLSTDETAANKAQIATVNGYTDFQAWDWQSNQKSATITLQAGKVYYMEVNHLEGGGGDHASVAWQGPGISRSAIPESAIFPNAAGANFDNPPVPPTIAVTSPSAGAQFTGGEDVTLTATVAGGSLTVATVEFYRGLTLIAADNSAPFSVTWSDVPAGNHTLSAKAVYSGGSVTSSGVAVSVTNSDLDADGDGLTSSQELTHGTNPDLADTDGDGFSDGYEVVHNSDPTNANDRPGTLVAAHWDFNDAATPATSRDRIGAVPGSLLGGAVLGADGSGRSGQAGDRALDLGTTGAGQRVEVSSLSFLQQAAQNNDLTISFWQKLSTTGSSMSSLWAVSPTSGDNQRGIQAHTPWSTGTVYFDCGNSTGGYRVSGAPSGVTWTNWNHIALVRRPGIAEIWINGNRLVSGSNMQALVSDFTKLYIGCANGATNSVRGKLDDFAVFGSALGSSQIAALAAGGQPDAIPANQAPSFAADPIVKSAATEDTAYAGSLSGDAGDPDAGDTRTFTKISGPAWLTVASNGTLGGTPSNANVGANNFVIRVADSGGLTDDAALQITVANVNDAPVFTALADVKADEDESFTTSVAAAASDVDAGDALTFSKVSGPAWLSVASNGTVSGTPTQNEVGANNLVIRVTDAGGLTDEATQVITVTNVNDVPVFTADPIAGTGATEGSAYSGSITGSATDVDSGDTLTYSKVSGPAWLSVAGNGNLTGTPMLGTTGNNSFTVRVTDAAGASDNAVLTIQVTKPAGSGDADGDGFSNALEESLGTDPYNSNSKPDPVFAGLQAWWKLDETSGTVAADATGRAQNGTLVGSPAWVSGLSGNAVAFNGTSQSIQIPSLSLNTNTVTLSAWVKRNGAQTSWAGLVFDRGNSASGLGFGTGNQLRYHWNDSGSTYNFSSGLTVPDNTWTFCAVVVEPTKATLYMQPAGGAMQSATNTISHATHLFSSNMYFGQDSFGGRFFKGDLDNTQIHSRALSAAEIGQLANQYALPLPWANATVGTGALTGAAQHANGKYTVSGSGVLGGTADQAHAAYQTLTGDGEIVAKIASLQNTGTSAAVGVVVRDSLAAGAPHVFVGTDGAGTYKWSRRTMTGSAATVTTGSAGTPGSQWVRIARSGNTFTVSTSADGTNWSVLGSAGVTMASNCYIGLSVSSGSTTTLNTSQFSNVSVTP